MIGGVVEVAETGKHISVYRGFLKVSDDNVEIGKVPLDDISALILSAPQVTLSKQLMVELAERKVTIVTCGRNWHPLSLTFPFAAHFESAGILHDQIEASAPLKKRLWKSIIKAKIAHQGAVLARYFPAHKKVAWLSALERRVKSGDPENLEAQAARHYWPALMGKGFRRNRFIEDVNIYLNYGYTILRAATARSVCAAGLHPALGLHHGARKNPFALVDDLMEPFRPLVDSIAYNLVEEGGPPKLTPENKRSLVAVLQEDLVGERGLSPLVNCLGALAVSVAACLGKSEKDVAIASIRSRDQLL